MGRVAAGTPRGPDPETGRAPRTAYTQEQYDALETMKDPGYSLGVARAEFANVMLLPDGSTSTDLEAMHEGARTELRGALDRAMASDADADALAAASMAARRAREIEDHIDQKRFLFIVDADLNPLIYFQTAVDHNTDVHHLRISPSEGTATPATAPDEG